MSEIKTIMTNDGYFCRCQFLKESAAKSKGKILDIGCNDAFMFRDLDLKNITYFDIENKIPSSYNLNFVQGNAENLPFEDGEFDTVIIGEVLEHVDSPVQVLKECKRVGKNIYITTPNEWEWTEIKRPFTTKGHIRFFTEDVLKKDLEDAGIKKYNMFKINGDGWSFFCVEVIDDTKS